MAKVEQVLSLEPQHELKFRGKPQAGCLLPRARPGAPRAVPRRTGRPGGEVGPAPTRRRVRHVPSEAEGQRRPGAWGLGVGSGVRCRSSLSLQLLYTVAF